MEKIKEIFSNKKVLIGVTIVIVLLIVGVAIVLVMQNKDKKEKTEDKSSTTEETEVETTINEETTTSKPKETESTTIKQEETTINLREYYENIIKGYTIDKPEEVTDKGMFLSKINGLTEVQENVEGSFKNEELTESDYNDLNTMINDLISLYNRRIEEIEVSTTTMPPTTSAEVITTTQPTTSEPQTTTLPEETTTKNVFSNLGDRTDESENPYIYRDSLTESNIVYNADGTANLKETTFIPESHSKNQDAWASDFFAFMKTIPEIKEVLNQNSNYVVSYTTIGKYRDLRYKNWDIRDYYLFVRDSSNNNSLIKMFHVNNNFEVIEGPIQEDIDVGKIFR